MLLLFECDKTSFVKFSVYERYIKRKIRCHVRTLLGLLINPSTSCQFDKDIFDVVREMFS